ncbi:protein of unknown function (DUF928) [Nostoc sp. PCC 7524]|uniref:DUF928 domain-containing protein n=1 Tax=Nostoc sp. (strain ATCC 29411 / PCC 7524) TaxID=28072 RepID=UPI00029ED551|nr:DUF928 domain-containing protein [Nostoc sp. PCC 7524]AFY48313.1 protein of unknown function (DUF928) [Nostoc sp. PCC 7524]
MKLLLSLAVSYTSLLASQTWVLAKPAPSNSPVTHTQKVSFVPPPAPTSEPPPGGRVRGGAKRGSCPLVKPELTALVPFTEDAPTVTNVWGLTTQEHPTLMFYVPYADNANYPTEFVLQDQDDNSVYQTAIALPKTAGVISVSLPSNISPLTVNQRYRWFLTVYCDPEKQSPPIYVEGVIKRVTLNPTTLEQLKTATPLQRVDIYIRNKIWHEAAVTLAQLRQQNPQNKAIQEQWQNLLTSIGLSDIATVPLSSNQP